LAQVLLGIPTDSYFDDFWLLMLAWDTITDPDIALSAFDALGEFMELLGFEFKTAKDIPPGEGGDLLGHFVKVGFPPYVVRPTESRKEKVRDFVKITIEKDTLTPTDAGKFAGQVNFLQGALYGSVGRAPLKAVYARQHSRVHVVRLTPLLKVALQWLLKIVDEADPRPIRLVGDVRPHAIAFVDASGAGWLAALLISPNGHRAYVKYFLDDSFKGFLKPRGNYIQFLEMAAAYLLLCSFENELHGCELDLYCDNIAQQGALRKGFSRAWDFAVVAGTFWGKAAELKIDVWTERVPSAFNPSDYPTRFVPDDINGYARAIEALGFIEKIPGPLLPLFEALTLLRARDEPQ